MCVVCAWLTTGNLVTNIEGTHEKDEHEGFPQGFQRISENKGQA